MDDALLIQEYVLFEIRYLVMRYDTGHTSVVQTTASFTVFMEVSQLLIVRFWDSYPRWSIC